MERTFKHQHGEATHKVSARRERDTIHLTTADGVRSFGWEALGAGDYLLRDGGKLRRCVVARQGDVHWVWIEGHVHQLDVVTAARRKTSSDGGLSAPMPGQVLKVLVSPGDAVDKNQTLVILEAMKMQCEIKAPRDGRIASVGAREGEQVSGGQELVTLEVESAQSANTESTDTDATDTESPSR